MSRRTSKLCAWNLCVITALTAQACGGRVADGAASSGNASGGDASTSSSGSANDFAGMSFGGATGVAGAATAGSSARAFPVPLLQDATGYVDGSNALGITAVWYAYSDGDGSDGGPAGSCETAGGHEPSQCSHVYFPVPGSGSFPNSGALCTKGAAAQVIADATGAPDYSHIWGSGIGIAFLANGSATALNLASLGVSGMQFDIDVPPVGGLRVEFQTALSDALGKGSSYWSATSSYPPSPVKSGTNVIHWVDVTSPAPSVVVPFDPTSVDGFQFHVPTTAAGATTYAFCISNIELF